MSINKKNYVCLTVLATKLEGCVDVSTLRRHVKRGTIKKPKFIGRKCFIPRTEYNRILEEGLPYYSDRKTATKA